VCTKRVAAPAERAAGFVFGPRLSALDDALSEALCSVRAPRLTCFPTTATSVPPPTVVDELSLERHGARCAAHAIAHFQRPRAHAFPPPRGSRACVPNARGAFGLAPPPLAFLEGECALPCTAWRPVHCTSCSSRPHRTWPPSLCLRACTHPAGLGMAPPPRTLGHFAPRKAEQCHAEPCARDTAQFSARIYRLPASRAPRALAAERWRTEILHTRACAQQ